jgi:uncharacterized protein YjbJ (UPF0337 family)
MKRSTENEVNGKLFQIKGAMRQKMGRLMDNPKMEIEGAAEKLAGKLQSRLGQVQKLAEKP